MALRPGTYVGMYAGQQEIVRYILAGSSCKLNCKLNGTGGCLPKQNPVRQDPEIAKRKHSESHNKLFAVLL